MVVKSKAKNLSKFYFNLAKNDREYDSEDHYTSVVESDKRQEEKKSAKKSSKRSDINS